MLRSHGSLLGTFQGLLGKLGVGCSTHSDLDCSKIISFIQTIRLCHTKRTTIFLSFISQVSFVTSSLYFVSIIY